MQFSMPCLKGREIVMLSIVGRNGLNVSAFHLVVGFTTKLAFTVH